MSGLTEHAEFAEGTSAIPAVMDDSTRLGLYLIKEASEEVKRTPEGQADTTRVDKAGTIFKQQFENISQRTRPFAMDTLPQLMSRAQDGAVRHYAERTDLRDKVKDNKIELIRMLGAEQQSFSSAVRYFKGDQFYTEHSRNIDWYFRDADTSGGKALREVLQNLSAKTARDLRALLDTPNVRIHFASNNVSTQSLATTNYSATLRRGTPGKERTFTLDRMSTATDKDDQAYYHKYLVSDVPIDIQIDLYRKSFNEGDENQRKAEMAEALLHELTGHVLPVKAWIDDLRQGTDGADQMLKAWEQNHNHGREKHHEQMVRGNNRYFNETANRIYDALPLTQRSHFRIGAQEYIKRKAEKLDVTASRQPISSS